jgi:signal transduction histidine kinase
LRTALIAPNRAVMLARALRATPGLAAASLAVFESPAEFLERDTNAELAVVECAGFAARTALARLRAAREELAILAVLVEPDDPAAVFDAGADEAIAETDADPRVLAYAARYARSRRLSRSSELDMIEATARFAERLATEEDPEDVAARVLEAIARQTGAEIGLLDYEWDWGGDAGRVVSSRGLFLDDERGRAIANHPALSPLRSRPGLHAVDIESGSAPPIRSYLCVRIGPDNALGRGAIVAASRRPRAFTERDLGAARALAAGAGVAVVNASIRLQRNRAIETRENVLAVVSHDLRSPLSVCSMALALMADTDDALERASLRQRTQRSIDAMDRLLNDLLDYAALDAGKLRIVREPTAAAAIAARIIAAASPGAEKAGIDLSLEISGDPRLDADAARVEQALGNVVSNAIKFTPAGGRVEVEVAGHRDNVVFSVSDTGPGIPDHLQRTLFDRYQTSSRARDGVGIGLSIARGIVAAHGGSILVESTLGEGSTFLLTFPMASGGRGVGVR